MRPKLNVFAPFVAVLVKVYSYGVNLVLVMVSIGLQFC